MQRLVSDLLDTMPWGRATLVLLAENVAIFVAVLVLGAWVVRRFHHRRVTAPAPPLERTEWVLAAVTVLLNTAVTVLGLWMYRRGLVVFRRDVGLRALLDVPILLLAMDMAMYFLHRIAHIPFIFDILHARHHRYDRPRPLTLFVLHPLETLSFGALWLAVITVYDASFLGMAIYLALNVVFGAAGHLGVEPLPPGWPRLELADATFHARHHQSKAGNFGFYTRLWDRVFGTLHRE